MKNLITGSLIFSLSAGTALGQFDNFKSKSRFNTKKNAVKKPQFKDDESNAKTIYTRNWNLFLTWKISSIL